MSKLPTGELGGEQVPLGCKQIRIELYDDDTIDIIVSDCAFATEWFELGDGTLRRAEDTGRADMVLYHIEPSGEYTIQSLTAGAVFPRTTQTSADILSAYSPAAMVELLAKDPSAVMERDASGRILRVETRSPDGRPVTVLCEGWEDLPISHPRHLTRTQFTRNGRRADIVSRFSLTAKSDG